MKKAAQTPPFDLKLPQEVRTSVVFASPHSGRCYFSSFQQQTILDPLTLRSSEDAFVDDLAKFIPELGAPFLCATAPRAFVDLNRSHDEMDCAVVEGVFKISQNPRIASGLGVIPRVVANGRAIYRGKITFSEAKDRLDNIWRPYHHELSRILARTKAEFGRVILMDLHSMPHEAVASPAKSVASPEIVIGDRFGTSAGANITEHAVACFENAGFRVSVNRPFAGAYILKQYGHPKKNQHAIQIEIDRDLYLDSRAMKPNARFGETQQKLRQAIEMFVNIDRKDIPLAAE